MHWFSQEVQSLLIHWGYWALLVGLFGESMGLPLPGETVLMFASFLSEKTTHLQLEWIVLVGIAAAVMGDNLGYFLGRHFGNAFIYWAKKLLRLDDEDIGAAKEMIHRHGGKTIFFARFIVGLRTIAGPLAGSLDMEWRRFFKFNLLGAATWVAAIASLGYAFAGKFQSLLDYIEKASWVIGGALFAVGYLIWRKEKKRYKQQHHPRAA